MGYNIIYIYIRGGQNKAKLFFWLAPYIFSFYSPSHFQKYKIYLCRTLGSASHRMHISICESAISANMKLSSCTWNSIVIQHYVSKLFSFRLVLVRAFQWYPTWPIYVYYVVCTEVCTDVHARVKKCLVCMLVLST